MITYKTNPNNREYIITNAKFTCTSLFLIEKDHPLEKKMSEELRAEINQMYASLFQYEKEQKENVYITDVSIKKTSALGKFMIENTDMLQRVNEDCLITYEKVVSAFNTAVFENNLLALEILPLFQAQISGTIEKLSKTYTEDVLTYIVEHPSFETHLEKINGPYEENLEIVYENGEYKEKSLISESKETVQKTEVTYQKMNSFIPKPKK